MTVGLFRLKKQGYDFPPYRPPSESESLLLRLTRGCPWNRCSFCSMYRGVAFERRSVDEIEKDIKTAATHCSSQVRTVFIGDSNSLVLQPGTLIQIMHTLYEHFPLIERVTSYARAKTVARMKQNALNSIRAAGLTRLHIGLETGNPFLLKSIKKGALPADFDAAAKAAKDAGFELSFYVLLGIGGQDLWKAHAMDTADILNRTDPHFIRARTVHPQTGSELYEQCLTGGFKKALPITVLREQRLLIAHLDVTSRYLSDHISNYIPVNGTLPVHKEEMLALIDQHIDALEHSSELQQVFQRKDSLNRL